MSIMQIFANILQEDPKKYAALSKFLQNITNDSASIVQENFAWPDAEHQKNNVQDTKPLNVNIKLFLEKFKAIKQAMNVNDKGLINNKAGYHHDQLRDNNQRQALNKHNIFLNQSYRANQPDNAPLDYKSKAMTANVLDIETITSQILKPQALPYQLQNQPHIYRQNLANNTNNTTIEKQNNSLAAGGYRHEIFQNSLLENSATFQNIINAKQQLQNISQNHIPAHMATTIKNQNGYKNMQNSISVAPANITINSNQSEKAIQQACEKIVQSAFEQSIAAASSGYDDGVLY